MLDYERRDRMLNLTYFLTGFMVALAFVIPYPLWLTGFLMLGIFFPGGVLVEIPVKLLFGPSVPGAYWSYAPMTPRKAVDILMASFMTGGLIVLVIAAMAGIWNLIASG